MELPAAGVARPARDPGPVAGAVPLARFVGIPWCDHGRDFSGVDCWGLVRLRLRHGYDVEVPSYGEISARELAHVTQTIRDAAASEPWSGVAPDAIRAGDVVLMRGRPLHVGIVECNGCALQVLHVEERTDSVLLPLTHGTVAFRIIGYRRHRDLIVKP